LRVMFSPASAWMIAARRMMDQGRSMRLDSKTRLSRLFIPHGKDLPFFSLTVAYQRASALRKLAA
jgi:hypothetical protein